jgi:hypothetical protein
MSAEDDEIRRALSGGTPPVTAPAVFRELRPSMRRARTRRRVAVSAAAATLLISGAGVFALTAHREQTTLRSVASEGSGRPLPSVTEVVVSSTSATTTVAAPEEPLTLIEPPTTVAPSPPGEVGEAPTEDVETRSVDDEPPVTSISAETATSPTPAPVPASFQTITSACGDVVVSIEAGTVQIATITARPGFDHQVSDDGPNSIELTFTGDGDQTCEVHAELKPSGLDVEVQNAEAER